MTQIRFLSAYRRGKKVRLGAGKAMIVAVVSVDVLSRSGKHALARRLFEINVPFSSGRNPG